MEPVSIQPHRAVKGGKQIIFLCTDDGLGISAVTAPGSRFGNGRDELGHGLYCENAPGLPTQYEALMVENVRQVGDRWTFDLIDNVEPKGWLYVEEIGALGESIAAMGRDGW